MIGDECSGFLLLPCRPPTWAWVLEGGAPFGGMVYNAFGPAARVLHLCSFCALWLLPAEAQDLLCNCARKPDNQDHNEGTSKGCCGPKCVLGHPTKEVPSPRPRPM